MNFFKKLIKFIMWGGYYLLAQHFPQSHIPVFGMLGKNVRFFFCRCVFERCGKGCNIDRRAYFGFNKIIIGDGSGIGANFHLQGCELEMGKNILMAPNVTILGSGHRYERKDVLIGAQGNFPKGKITIGDDCWIGRNVTILPGCKNIGRGVVVGACSVVTKDIPDYEVWCGNPAKFVKRRV